MRLIIIILFIPFLAYSQARDNGIKFETELDWKQIKAKAAEEKKYIFLDCYASWCGPCKLMDKNVYSNKKVGDFFNNRFISVKVQFDSSANDGEVKKKWYSDAFVLKEVYHIDGYPTFLFFSPTGQLIQKDLGYKGADEFVNLASYVLESKRKEYFKQLDDFKKGKRDYSRMLELEWATRNVLGDKDMASKIAIDYKRNYLDKLPTEDILTRDIMNFIKVNYKLINTTDAIFSIFLHKSTEVDSLFNERGRCKKLITYYIVEDEIEKKIWKDGNYIIKNPRWDQIDKTIREKYGEEYSNGIVSDYKLKFYKRIKNWKKFAQLRSRELKRNPPTSSGNIFSTNSTWSLNSDAWDVFLNCKDRAILKKSLSWVNIAISLEGNSPNPQFLDTRANILYKLGLITEALDQEKKAIDLEIENAKASGRNTEQFLDDFYTALSKMKKGEKTW